MQVKIIGSFDNNQNSLNKKKTDNNISVLNFIQINEQYKHISQNKSCFAWGRFYDLEKSCHDLKLEPTDNPAQALLMALESDNYLNAGMFYGEFTFVFTDAGTVVVGCDHTGAGSQVFYNENHFSSTLTGFKKIPGFNFEINLAAISQFLNLGLPQPPETMIAGIKSLMPGEILIYQNNRVRTESIIPFSKYKGLHGSLQISAEEAAEEIERLHHAAIKRRIEGKKSIALLMSGGYDSGGNLAALRKIYQGNANGYSIGFKNDPWSELPLAEILAKHFDIKFHQYQIDGSEINHLPEIVSHLNNPFNENGLMVNYTVMRMLSSENNDVVLGGDGNDQLYGTGFQELALYHLAKKYGFNIVQKLMAGIMNSMGNSSGFITKARFHNNRILNANSLSSFGFTHTELNRLFAKKTTAVNSDLLFNNHIKPKSFKELFIANSYYKSLVHDGFNLIIFKASQMASLFGQPISFPYMDKDVMEFIWSLPREVRIAGSVKELAKGRGTAKFLHKKYLKPQLPPEITQRRKQGGFAPLPLFFQDTKIRNTVYSIVRESDLAAQYFNMQQLESLFNEFEKVMLDKNIWFWHRQNMAFKILNLLTITLWWEIHIKDQKISKLSNLT